jgi:hypothetical protein
MKKMIIAAAAVAAMTLTAPAFAQSAQSASDPSTPAAGTKTAANPAATGSEQPNSNVQGSTSWAREQPSTNAYGQSATNDNAQAAENNARRDAERR